MSADKRQWCYSIDAEQIDYHGPFGSRATALARAVEAGFADVDFEGDPDPLEEIIVWIARCEYPTGLEAAEAGPMLDAMMEFRDDNHHHQSAESWLSDVTGDQYDILSERLAEVVGTWLVDTGHQPNYFGAENVETIRVDRQGNEIDER